MKKLVCIAMLLAMLVSCGRKTTEPNSLIRFEQRAMQLKAERTMGGKADLLYLYAHQDGVEVYDTEHYAADPHAYWLYRCMTGMKIYTRTAEDNWAYYQALEKCVDDYNRRLDRKHGSMELAIQAVQELYGGWSAGTQYEMNSGSGLELLMDEIRMIGAYRDLAGYTKADREGEALGGWYGKEYKTWHHFIDLAKALMYNHTFGMARYSAAPLEMNLIQEDWYEGRLKWLEQEKRCVQDFGTEEFKFEGRPKTDADLTEIINYFYNCVPTAGWDDIRSTWNDNDDDIMRPYRENSEDAGHPRLIAYHLKKAIKEWQSVRQDICEFLPAEKQAQYRDLTQALQNFIYEILEGLKATYS